MVVVEELGFDWYAETSSNQINTEVQVRCLMVESHVKRTRQSVLTVVKNAKCHSNLTRADQFTVENVGLREDQRDQDHATRFHKVRLLTLAINL